MLDLAKNIHELMLEHDCVSIPDFGGIVAQRFRAEINPGTNIMRPPSKRISFHKELVANSHLLLQKVAKENKLSQAKAIEQIAVEVAAWKAELTSGNSIKLNGVGRFYLDKSGSICFNQSLESNFDLDAFGLEMFRATAIKRDEEIKESVSVAIAESVKKTQQKVPFWRSAAVFAGIGALLTIAFFKTDFSVQDRFIANINPLHYSRALQIPVAQAKEIDAPEKEEMAPATIQYEDVVVENDAVIETTPEIEPVTQHLVSGRELASFEVIVGSFKEVANAEEMLNSLTAKGYQPQIVHDNSGFAKVSIEGFSNRTEAVQAMRAYQLSVNKGAWIYSR